MTEQNRVRERDHHLDVWRGISVLMVLVHHTFYFHYPFFKEFAHQSTTGAVTVFRYLDVVLVEFAERSGPLGVKIFFIISGYIITKLMVDEEVRNGSFSILQFYIRRILRIFPALLFYLLSLGALSVLGYISLQHQELLHSISFLCNTNTYCGWNTIHTWTLATEMQFYIVWPFLFLLAPKRLRAHLLAGMIVLFTIFSGLGILTTQGWIDNPISFICIAVGVLTALSHRFKDFLTNRTVSLVFVLVAGVLLLYLFVPGESARILYRESIPWVLATVVFGSYRLDWVTHYKSYMWLSYLGLISYSLYLWQQVFLSPDTERLIPSFLDYPILMFVLAFFSYRYIEKPALRLGKYVLTRYIQTPSSPPAL